MKTYFLLKMLIWCWFQCRTLMEAWAPLEQPRRLTVQFHPTLQLQTVIPLKLWRWRGPIPRLLQRNQVSWNLCGCVYACASVWCDKKFSLMDSKVVNVFIISKEKRKEIAEEDVKGDLLGLGSNNSSASTTSSTSSAAAKGAKRSRRVPDL